MKPIALATCFLAFGVSTALPGAGEAPPSLNAANDAAPLRTGTGPAVRPPLAPGLPEFAAVLQSVVRSRDLARIAGLYQTNGISEAELKADLERWPHLWAKASKPVVHLYFKELAVLPPTARQVWGDVVARLTTHKATHLALVGCDGGAQRMLPLVQVDGGLRIVTSDRHARDGQNATGSVPHGP